jgi:23S rRNA G2445 N2-methylase RlmL
LLELTREECGSLDEIATLVETVDIPRYLGPEQSFAVRAQRRGDQPFGSPDVESRVGRAIIDSYRATEQRRPPVDLETPDLVFRVFVRKRRVILTIDTTGQRSLHRRGYRVAEHEAPIRPTMAAAMIRLADCQPGDRVVDPMCGCGTIPIEAAAMANERALEVDFTPAFTRLQCLDTDELAGEEHSDPTGRGPLDIAGFDIDDHAVADATENARQAGLNDAITFETADLRERPIAADIVVTDMPFGIRTDGEIQSLYHEFADRLVTADCRRAVVHTARENLLGVEPTNRIEMRRGRLETVLLVIE